MAQRLNNDPRSISLIWVAADPRLMHTFNQDCVAIFWVDIDYPAEAVRNLNIIA
jgi:hypothetical protein